MISFKKFLSEEKVKRMTPMTVKEWLKYDWRIEVFLKMYKNKEQFFLKDGRKMFFVYNPSVEKNVKSRDKAKLEKVVLEGIDGKPYKISAIGKSKEFGGKGAGAGTAKEDEQLKILKNRLEDIKANEVISATVPIRIGNKVHNIFSAATTPGTPKSDFHLLDSNAKEVVWISHKDGKTPKDFQQWGGISLRNEPEIFKHPEVQSFVADLKREYPDGLPRATTLYRKIKDRKLKMMSVYGNQYGKPLGRQNTSIMIQGPVKLVRKGKVYEFESNHVHLNGEDMTGGFEPVLTAIYKGDRSDAGVKGTRIVIMPIGGRKMTGEI